MLINITLCLRHRGRVNNRKKIAFQPGLNIIIGPNGSGKSSLLEAIKTCPDCICQYDRKTICHYFNSETMNPHRNSEHFRGVEGSLIKVRSMFSSHGETLRDVLRFIPLHPGDCFLLDEPETGHDIDWVIKIHNALRVITQHGCQIIAASHHPVFWNEANMIELQRNYYQRSRRKFLKIIC